MSLLHFVYPQSTIEDNFCKTASFSLAYMQYNQELAFTKWVYIKPIYPLTFYISWFGLSFVLLHLISPSKFIRVNFSSLSPISLFIEQPTLTIKKAKTGYKIWRITTKKLWMHKLYWFETHESVLFSDTLKRFIKTIS